jgi:hypothetical protein
MKTEQKKEKTNERKQVNPNQLSLITLLIN